jgi:hypothetical protein
MIFIPSEVYPRYTNVMASPNDIHQNGLLTPVLNQALNVYVDEANGFVFDRRSGKIYTHLKEDKITKLSDDQKAFLDRHGCEYDESLFYAANRSSVVVSRESPISDLHDAEEFDDPYGRPSTAVQSIMLDDGTREELVGRASKMVTDILLAERQTERKERIELRAQWREERKERLLAKRIATDDLGRQLIPLLQSQVATMRDANRVLKTWAIVSETIKGVAALSFLWYLWRGSKPTSNH